MDHSHDWHITYPALYQLTRTTRELLMQTESANRIILQEWEKNQVLSEAELTQLERTYRKLQDGIIEYGEARTEYIMEQAKLNNEDSELLERVIAAERIDLSDPRIKANEVRAAAGFQLKTLQNQRTEHLQQLMDKQREELAEQLRQNDASIAEIEQKKRQEEYDLEQLRKYQRQQAQLAELEQQQHRRSFQQDGPHSMSHQAGQNLRMDSQANTTELLLQQMMELVKTLKQPAASATTMVQRQPIKVPTFDGEPENFKSYWTRFNSLIHNEPSFSTAEKINMLYEGLSGKAKRLVNVDPTVENYEYIRKLMEKEYGAHKADLYNIMLQLQAVRPAPLRAKECERTHREIKGYLRRLETAGSIITREILVSQVFTKFPFKVVKKLVMKAEEMSVEELLDNLHDKITEFKIEEEKEDLHKRNAAVGLPSNNPNRLQTNSTIECVFCQRKGHAAGQCRTHATPAERRNAIKDRKVCWVCFSSNHMSRECLKPKCGKCQMGHNELLCMTRAQPKPIEVKGGKKPFNQASNMQLLAYSKNDEEEQTSTTSESGSSTDEERVMLHSDDQKTKKKRLRVVLKTAEIKVFNHIHQKYVKLNAIIDEGSTRSMITEEVAKSFQLPVRSSATRTFFGIGGLEETHKTHEVTIKLKTKEGSSKLVVSTKPKITVPVRAPILSKEDHSFILSKEWNTASPYSNGEKVTIDVLIGLDCYGAITNKTSTEETLPSGLLARSTKIGMLIYGATTTKPRRTKEVALFASNATEEREITSEEIAQKLFNIDNMGVDPTEEQEEQVTRAYYEEYAQKIRYEGNRIVAPFPIKDNINLLKDNKGVAIRRLHCLLTQLGRNQTQKDWYNTIMDDYIKQGVVEKVPRVDTTSCMYYIPHHGVWKPDKAKPLRIVFDASSKTKGAPSLNDVITTGSIFINKIHDIIVANRFHKIIMMCDIEAAFTQIKIRDQDKDLCRFFWVEQNSDGVEKITTYRFCRLPFGITSSPSILNMCLTHFLENERTELAQEILKLLYVDNITIGADNEKEALKKYSESKAMFKKISMNIREYITNNTLVNDAIPEEDKLNEHKVKMLGIPFNIRRYELTTQVKLETCDMLTKRMMLR